MPLDLKYLQERFLPFVEKPDRYTGAELALPELPNRSILRAAIAFPDLYELGMSYLGLRILLHLGNQVPGVSCERVFMPWFDAVERLRALDLPLFTLETKTPLHELDLLGLNLQYELHATNILAMLELGRIPARAEQRTEADPIVLGGGPLAYNPEPFSPFFDAIAVGDGEEIFPEILSILIEEKSKGSSRARRIRALGDVPGIYLPSYYQPQYDKNGEYVGLKPTDSGLPSTIWARITPTLLPEHYPRRPVVPTLEATHNRLVLEIARGCSRGCRFCGPGMSNRPVRERPISDLVHEAQTGLEATGYSQVSLLSLSTADYRYLEPLLTSLDPVLIAHQASLSFPSLRPDRFTVSMAERASAQLHTGLTFAPEAATPRLRAVINKDTTDEALLQAARVAFEHGWGKLKLYFMIGLPTETDEDVKAIVKMVRQVEAIGRIHHGRRINVSISPFSPKPHTPFERLSQLPLEDLHRRLGILSNGLRGGRSINLEVRAPEISRVECAISRSDRRGADAIEASYRAGGLFDAWRDGFDWQRWVEAFHTAGLNLEKITGRINAGKPLPWDHIDAGISPDFLESELNAAQKPEFTPDCRTSNCQFCGLQIRSDLTCPEIPDLFIDVSSITPPAVGFQKLTEAVPSSNRRYRLKYSRGQESRFTGHLSVMGILERALRRLGVPIEFTQGYRPHPRLAFSPPLGVGMTSRGEFVDFGIGAEWSSSLMDRLREALPPGIEAINVIELPKNQPSIGAINTFFYRACERAASTPGNYRREIEALLSSQTLPILRTQPKKARAFDARPSIWKLAQDGEFIFIGLKAVGGPVPRIDEILQLIMGFGRDTIPMATSEIIAAWEIERIEMGWEIGGIFISPTQTLLPDESNQNKIDQT